MSYSPALGFKPLTIEEIVELYRQKWNELTNQNLDLLQFKGLNAFRVAFDYAQNLADLQSIQGQLINDFFFFLTNTQVQIDSGIGSTYIAFEKAFKNECVGINLPRPTTNASQPIYFDTPNDENPVRFGQLFSTCIPVGTITEGDITVYFTDVLGVSREVKYSKITEDDYINLDIKIQYKIKANASPIVEVDVKDLFIKRFNEVNKIGSIFYPDSYISTQDFPSVADFNITSSLNETDFNDEERDPTAGDKYKLGLILLERVF